MSSSCAVEGRQIAGAGTGRVFYGWFVVGALFVMLATSAGLGFYGLTVYLRALTTQLGLSVAAASAATATFFVVTGISGPLLARLLARHDPRVTTTGGALVAGAALLLLGRVEALWQIYAVYALFGLGFAGSSLLPASTVITRWFARRRSLALSVASTGLSVGGIAITPVVARLVAELGIRGASPWLALAFVVGVVPVTLALLRATPAALGLRPDGDAPSPGGDAAPAGTPLAIASRSRYFLGVTAAYVLVMLAQVGGMAHHYNLVAERLDPVRAALAVSTLAAASVVGRLIGGWVVTVVPMRRVAAVLILVQGGALLFLATSTNAPQLLVGSALLGLSVGNLLMLHPLLLADAFGVADFSRIFSRSQLVMTIGIAAGPSLIGLVHDLGGYDLALTLAAFACLPPAVLLTALRPPHPLAAAS